jgi:dihydroflavonol-4-reductase
MSRYLVTGATGFLGGHLTASLREHGHEVVALCRQAGREEEALRAQGAAVARGDVLDAQSVSAAAAGCDGLFHCAGKVSRRPEDAEELYRLHVDGTKITLDACRAAGVRRAVIASTSGVVAVSKDAREVRDEMAPAPMEIIAAWPYYRSKLYAERAALDRSQQGFEVVSVNPSLLLGPGDLNGSSTGDVVQFLEQRVPMIPAGGISFVDVRDAAEAMRLAMEKGRAGERYLVGAMNLTVQAFLERLERISGVPAPKVKLPGSVLLAGLGADLMGRAAKRMNMKAPSDRVTVEMGQHFWYVDTQKARAELGWTPRDAGETLADTVDDLRRRGVVWPRATR